MNVYQKLVEVRKVVTYLQKEKEGAQYKYVASSQVLHAVRAKMDEVQLLLIPEITSHKVSESIIEYKDSKGEINKRTITYFTEIDMTMTWVNAENPEEQIKRSWYAQGVDIAGEKGVGKATTYGEKTFILKQFNIPTDNDDPDMIQQQPRNQPFSPAVGGKKADEGISEDLAAFEQATREANSEVGGASQGQLNMLHAKASAAGLSANKEQLAAKVSTFLGYAVTDFSGVKKADVTRLAQYLDKQKKAS